MGLIIVAGVLSLVLRLSALASLLMLVTAWNGEAKAADAMDHAAMPCHQADMTQKAPQPHHQHDGKSGGHGCPDCRCVASGCVIASLTAPQTQVPVDFTVQALSPMGLPPLFAQAITGPPVEPPRA